jgi:glycosyltransferase involved in cell wall biosynthesis
MTSIGALLPVWVLSCMSVTKARHFAKQRLDANRTSSTSVKQVLVDVSVIYQNDARTGIQRVVRALLLQLINSPPVGYLVRPVFATRQHGYSYADPDLLVSMLSTTPLAPKTTSVPSLVQVDTGDIFLGLDLAAHLLPRYRSQILSWKRAGVQVHVLVYDLLPLLHPEWFHRKTHRNFKRWIRWVATYVDNAICISESVRSDLSHCMEAHFGLKYLALPIARISLGADIAASAPTHGQPPYIVSILERLKATKSLLMVGTVEPRKGHDQVLAAFEQLLQHRDLQSDQPTTILVIVGRPGWKTEKLQQQLREHPQAGKLLIWFEDASDELLSQLYSACTVVISASHGEGFGLPLIEAIEHGKPVIARDLPVFRELDIPGIFYFKGNSAGALAETVASVLATDGQKYNTKLINYKWDSAGAELKAILVRKMLFVENDNG